MPAFTGSHHLSGPRIGVHIRIQICFCPEHFHYFVSLPIRNRLPIHLWNFQDHLRTHCRMRLLFQCHIPPALSWRDRVFYPSGNHLRCSDLQKGIESLACISLIHQTSLIVLDCPTPVPEDDMHSNQTQPSCLVCTLSLSYPES